MKSEKCSKSHHKDHNTIIKETIDFVFIAQIPKICFSNFFS